MEEKKQPEGIRINKYLSEAGICSRRAADREIEAGHVTINGRIAQMGDRVFPQDRVLAGGREARLEETPVLIAFHKPVGIVCTAQKKEKNNIIDYIHYPQRIYPIGRLDKDSEGLILLTNQGDLVNKIMRAGNYHEKEYIVTVDKKITTDFLQHMRAGVHLKELEVTTRVCKVKKLDDFRFRIILTQGYNRQIRRMCEALGYRVQRLIRVRIMNIELGDLKKGTYRDVTKDEYQKLLAQLKDSYSAPKQLEKGKKEREYGDQRRNRRTSKKNRIS